MIPYDDLVVALQTWRAKQGLPIAELPEVSRALTPPTVPAASARSAPPSPPPGRAASGSFDNMAASSALGDGADSHDETLDVDGALVEESHLEPEGDDFAMAFNSAIQRDGDDDVEGRPTEANLDGGTEVASPAGRRGGRNDEW